MINPYKFFVNYLKKTDIFNETSENYKNLIDKNCTKKERIFRYIYDFDNNIIFKLKSKRHINSNLLDKYYIKNILDEGSFSKVYQLFTNNKNPYLILKYIDNKDNNIENIKKELKTYIFNILLQCYLQDKDKNNLEYICKIKEYGKIYLNDTKNRYSFYCIMDNCGENLNNLVKIFIYNEKKNINNIKDDIKGLIKIFIECCNAVNVLHKLDYVHNDIKPENFLFNKNNKGNKIKIKIIDFGGVKKNNIETDDYTYTKLYCDPNIIEKIYSNDNKLIIKINKKFDIFSLGITFLSILLQYFNLGTYSQFSTFKFYEINDNKKYIFNYIKYIQLFKNDILFNEFIADILIKINQKIKKYKNPDIIIYLMYIIKLMINRINNTKVNLDDLIKKFNKLFEL